jgi:exosortase A-associated hydrolase 2
VSRPPGVFFLGAAVGEQRLCVHHAPATTQALGCVVFVHPWAEEMNKARRMCAKQSRALAGIGFAVLQIDLRGCGDSSGDFGDTRWAHWVDDVVMACNWMRATYDVPLWLWGLRSGCLVATQAAARVADASRFLFWQPPTNGKPLLQQFLRLKLAGGLMDGTGKAAMAELKQRLGAYQSVDVAGYRLSSDLAHGLEQAQLALPDRPCTVFAFEMTSQLDGDITPALASSIQRWASAGHAVATRLVMGPAFWQTVEIEDAPQLIVETCALLQTRTMA